MSSTYYILCLSHDPAVLAGEYGTPDLAVDAIKAGDHLHPGCDLMIERVSGGPVEIGCPPSETRDVGPRCYHRGTEWTDVDWLRLLAASYQTQDPAVQAAVSKLRQHCWPWERLRRLRDELGITLDQPQPPAAR